MKCSICGQVADGFHFNALSCAACGAFFRRSIADQKTYSCSTKDCDILQPRKHGNTCKYCRFQACIFNGMLPNEVQCKRRKVQAQTSCSTPPSSSSSSSSSLFFVSPSLPTPTTISRHSNSPKHKPKIFSLTKKRRPPITLQFSPHKPKNLVDQDSSFLEAICTARREIVGMRASAKISTNQNMFSTNYNNSKHFFEEEMHFFKTVLLENPIIQKIVHDSMENELDEADNWNFCFWVWCLLESALATLRYGGVQTGRIYFPDQGFLELQHEQFTNFFATQFPRDASSLARLSLPIAEFFVENLCRSLQAERLGGEHECAALLALVLCGVISEKGSATNAPTKTMDVKSQIFIELLEHYTTTSPSNACNSPVISSTQVLSGRDVRVPANKMGIVLLASSSLIEAVNMLKELYCCFQIVQDLD